MKQFKASEILEAIKSGKAKTYQCSYGEMILSIEDGELTHEFQKSDERISCEAYYLLIYEGHVVLNGDRDTEETNWYDEEVDCRIIPSDGVTIEDVKEEFTLHWEEYSEYRATYEDAEDFRAQHEYTHFYLEYRDGTEFALWLRKDADPREGTTCVGYAGWRERVRAVDKKTAIEMMLKNINFELDWPGRENRTVVYCD